MRSNWLKWSVLPAAFLSKRPQSAASRRIYRKKHNRKTEPRAGKA